MRDETQRGMRGPSNHARGPEGIRMLRRSRSGTLPPMLASSIGWIESDSAQTAEHQDEARILADPDNSRTWWGIVKLERPVVNFSYLLWGTADVSVRGNRSHQLHVDGILTDFEPADLDWSNRESLTYLEDVTLALIVVVPDSAVDSTAVNAVVHGRRNTSSAAPVFGFRVRWIYEDEYVEGERASAIMPGLGNFSVVRA